MVRPRGPWASKLGDFFSVKVGGGEILPWKNLRMIPSCSRWFSWGAEWQLRCFCRQSGGGWLITILNKVSLRVFMKLIYVCFESWDENPPKMILYPLIPDWWIKRLSFVHQDVLCGHPKSRDRICTLKYLHQKHGILGWSIQKAGPLASAIKDMWF